ncbi:MAG: peptidase, partial [Aquificota bacterium]
MLNETIILILFIIASVVAVIAKRLNLPYTIALVLIGLLLGFVNIIQAPPLTKEILYSIFLPALIFEAAIHLKARDLFREIWIVLTLVVPGVVLSTIITAGVLVGMGKEILHLDLPLTIAILFGAAVSATDPVAIVPLFKQMGVPKRLRFLVESESLLNDGTAIVAFVIAMGLVQHQISDPTNIGLMFFEVVGLGILVGSVIGLIIAYVIKYIDDPMVVITLTTVGAYFSFLIADSLNVSGVMSTVAAGLIIG